MRLFILFVFVSLISFAQQPERFVGKLIYRYEYVDTSLQKIQKPAFETVYTNDTLVRIENETSHLGQQVMLKHLELGKSYLMIRTAFGDFAIKSPSDSLRNDRSEAYSIKKKCGHKKIGGLRGKKLVVKKKSSGEEYVFYYSKKISPKCIEAFDFLPGLPLEYYLPGKEGVLKYTLTSIDFTTPNYDLFGIPSDYQKVSINEFMDLLLENAQNTPPQD